VIDAPLALAFTAGLVATVNPCGFAMLPAYLSYFMGLSDDRAQAGGAATVRRALVIGAVISSGFLLVFGVVGALVTLGLRAIIDLIPWAAMVIGGGVGILGIAMLLGYEPVVNLPKTGRARSGRRYSAVFVFGLSYAVASLSCTLPIFLAVVAGSIPRTNVVGGVLLFLVYGLGMSLVLVVLTLALALGKQRLVGWLRRSAASISRVSGAILLLAGGYIVWFWVTNLNDPLAASGPVIAVERWSSQLTQLIGDRPLLWGGALGTVTLIAVVYLLLGRRGSTDQT
jgi:cytochrome c-type biogenesis protein